MESIQYKGFNRYLPWALLYFFFNSLFLPLGLLYTTLLTPVLLFYLHRTPQARYIPLFFAVTLPFMLVHFINGVNLFVYLKSWMLLFTVFIFCLSVVRLLYVCSSLPYLFREVLILNTVLVALAIIIYAFPMLRDITWYRNQFTKGTGEIYRLKLFTYEASYYSLVMMPVFFYYFLKARNKIYPYRRFMLLLIIVPLLLSLSFGVLAALFIAALLLFFSDLGRIEQKPHVKYGVLFSFLFILLLLFIGIRFFPEHFIWQRLENIFRGRDTSFSGRTFDSLYLGWQIAEEKSLFFGCGPGQVKVLGAEIFNRFYVNTYTPEQLVIPNSMGDLLAQYGLVGVMIKLMAEIWLFFKTFVYLNVYRLGIFLFIFVYQFTGSYYTNIAEYSLWILCFSPALFPEFNRQLHTIHVSPPGNLNPQMPGL